ncbi:Pro-kumamolisin, activation domain-containing protein [Aspergillus sergii]|uniref:Pro-kumamolisin, activation domain-containing protein n=1 Tax=Aspergillus sergii TaxID=1034303 RepID=A0A5N6WMA4_9EURO|nr:Pro-kumamolisin, activation domain-containing protein [Aspergillus sergii]
MFAPSEDSVKSVRSWLESSGISPHRISQSTNNQWIQLDANAEELERLLHTEYYIYSHAETGQPHVACREYHVPSSVGDHIDYITPGITLREVTNAGKASSGFSKRSINGLPPIIEPMLMSVEQLLAGLGEFCGLAITPQCIQGKTAPKGNELGIFAGIGDVYAQEDLDLFFTTLASDIQSAVTIPGCC